MIGVSDPHRPNAHAGADGMLRPTRIGPRAGGSDDRPSGKGPSVGDEERGSRPRAPGPPRQMARSEGGPVGSGRRWRATAASYETPCQSANDGFRPLQGDWVLAYRVARGPSGNGDHGHHLGASSRLDPDAQINHGNSGGPSLTEMARVIGITSLRFVSGGSGLGFAVDARKLCPLLAGITGCGW